MADVFISYSRTDEAYIGDLVRLLEAHSLSVWWDRNLVGGTKFHRDIENEINNATKVIVLWSRRSVDSVWVYDEASAARDQGKLIPIAIDDCVIPMGFRSIHTLRSAKLDTIESDLLIACGRATTKPSKSSVPPQPEPISEPAPNNSARNPDGGTSRSDREAASSMPGIFEEFFGQRADAPDSESQRGSDLRYDMAISLEEAFRGATKKIQVTSDVHCGRCHGSGIEPGGDSHACPDCSGAGKIYTSEGFFKVERPCTACHGRGQTISDPCPSCSGTGRVARERTLSVKIPAGVENEMRIRLAGEGDAGLRGAQAGDLYAFLSIEPHPLFQRDGADIVCRVPVSFTTAALGGEIEVPVIDGSTVRVKLPEATQSGQQFRLKGKGMPVLRTESTGDMYIQIEVETPQSLHHNAKVFLDDLKRQRPPIAPQTVAVEERGLDLACEIQISVVEAALGGEVTFKPGTEPALLLRFPEGTQDRQTFRLRGKGKEGGDLYVTVRTLALANLTESERDLLNRLEALERLGQGPVYAERQSFLDRVKALIGSSTS